MESSQGPPFDTIHHPGQSIGNEIRLSRIFTRVERSAAEAKNRRYGIRIPACSFLIVGGVIRGRRPRYFSRRIIRARFRTGYKLGQKSRFFYRWCRT